MKLLIGFLALMLAAPSGTMGQNSEATPVFNQEQLDQMLAPIALYPDNLLAQILMAATYPIEVVQADRWVRANKNLKGQKLLDAAEKMDWDPSVKALVQFPEILSMMSDQLDWTQDLGDAFLAQEADVMDTVQKLRARAADQGNLKSTDQQKVIVEEKIIRIEPANPEVIYVPTYDPAVVYGSWWYPSYPPAVVYPYYYPAGAIIATGLISFAAGVAVGSYWDHGWGYWGWRSHDVHVNINRHINMHRWDYRTRGINTVRWQHDARHRKGVAYRDAYNRERYGRRGVRSFDGRRDYRGYDWRGTERRYGDSIHQRDTIQRRPSKAPVRPEGAPRINRPPDSTRRGFEQRRETRSSQQLRRTGDMRRTQQFQGQRFEQRGRSSAFEGMGRGSEIRMQADRGRSSRQQMSTGRFGGGGGRAGRGRR